MALQVSVDDNEDGTGAVVTITGASGTVEVWSQPCSGEIGLTENDVWTLSGTRSGNGTVDFEANAGHYFIYATDASGASPVVYCTVTDGVAAVYYRILLAVQAKIRLLGLSGIVNSNIVLREVAIDRELTLPAIAIAPYRPTMSATGGVLGFNDKVYGVLVAFYAADNQSHAHTGTYSKWMQQVENAFHNKRLTGVSEVITAEVTPGDAIPLEVWKANKYMGLILLKFTSREAA